MVGGTAAAAPGEEVPLQHWALEGRYLPGSREMLVGNLISLLITTCTTCEAAVLWCELLQGRTYPAATTAALGISSSSNASSESLSPSDAPWLCWGSLGR